MFEMEWRGRRVALKASNGRYVCMKKNGQLAAISDFVGEHSPPGQLGPLSRGGTCSETVSISVPHPSRAMEVLLLWQWPHLLVKVITVNIRGAVRSQGALVSTALL